jgi:putative salt-induced outer membrane protein YdiY
MMTNGRFFGVGCALAVVAACGLAAAEAPPAEKPADPDQVVLKDGSVLRGEILGMAGGELLVETTFGGEVKVKWAEVAGIRSDRPLRFVLSDGTELRGVAAASPQEGIVEISSELLGAPTPVNAGAISAINPPEKKAVTYTGSFGAGASVSDGNTRNRSASLVGEFVARSARQRLTLGGSYNYAEDSEGLTQRNAKARLKYDFFVTERLYAFASALLEGDKFQDLNLRAALGVGPGYQFIDAGDLEAELFSKLQLYGEAGVSYFNEDFESAEDTSYVSGRWAVKLDWPIGASGVTFFHFHEGYPGLERGDDIYVSTEQGLRFAVWGNLSGTAQVNWRWDNTPAPGFKRSDTLYLLTLGYNFEL